MTQVLLRCVDGSAVTCVSVIAETGGLWNSEHSVRIQLVNSQTGIPVALAMIATCGLVYLLRNVKSGWLQAGQPQLP